MKIIRLKTSTKESYRLKMIIQLAECFREPSCKHCGCREKSSGFFGLPPWEFGGKVLLFSMPEKNVYRRFRENSMFLNLAHCFILTFSQWHLVNLGVEIHLFKPEIIKI